MGLLKRLIVVKNVVMLLVLVLVIFEKWKRKWPLLSGWRGLATLGLIKQVLPLTKTWSVMMVHFVMVRMNLLGGLAIGVISHRKLGNVVDN